jgi:hypothetical protein
MAGPMPGSTPTAVPSSMFGVVAWALGARGIIRPLLAGGITSVVIWLLFVKALGVVLPGGRPGQQGSPGKTQTCSVSSTPLSFIDATPGRAG